MTGPEPRGPNGLTNGEVASRAGVSETEARRFWRALGFPDAGESARFSEPDVVALRTLREAMEAAGLDLDTGMRLARAVGQNVARMSDWQVAAITSRVESDDERPTPPRSRSPPGPGRRQRPVAAALEDVLVYAWHQHLAAAVRRLDGAGEPRGDAVGHGGIRRPGRFQCPVQRARLGRLGELVEIFESRCADVVAAHDGRMIKTLGDSVLFVADRAERAMDIAGGIVGRDRCGPTTARHQHRPRLRAGDHEAG